MTNIITREQFTQAIEAGIAAATMRGIQPRQIVRLRMLVKTATSIGATFNRVEPELGCPASRVGLTEDVEIAFAKAYDEALMNAGVAFDAAYLVDRINGRFEVSA